MQYLEICCIASFENLGKIFGCLQQTFLKIWCNLAKELGRYIYCSKNRFLAITSQKIGPQSPVKARYSIWVFYICQGSNACSKCMYHSLITEKLSKIFFTQGKFFSRISSKQSLIWDFFQLMQDWPRHIIFWVRPILRAAK